MSTPLTELSVYTPPMVLETDYQGATNVVQNDNVIETPDMLLEINKNNLCILLADKTKNNVELTMVCPVDLTYLLCIIINLVALYTRFCSAGNFLFWSS